MKIADWPKQVRSVQKILILTDGDPVVLYQKLKIFKDLIMRPPNSFWQNMTFTPNNFCSQWDNLAERKPILSNQQIKSQETVSFLETWMNKNAK